MKITIYELLGMVKDGKAPKKIKYDDMIWEYDGDYYSSKNNIILEEYCNLTASLKDEVEIIEPQEHKIPEKLDKYYDKDLEEYVVETYIKGVNYKEIFKSRYDEMIISKINEILDYLEEIE